MSLLLSSMLYILSLSSGTSFNNAQDSSAKKQDYDHYMQRSKNQRTVGAIFLATGIAGGSAVLLIALLSTVGDALVSVASLGYYQPKRRTYTIPLLLMGAVIGTGIGFFLAAERNKKIAKNLSVDVGVGNTSLLRQQDIKNYAYPTLSFKLRL